jgi:large subunit ribosomal protein L13
MKTFVPKKNDIERKWWIVDAEGKTLGRLATRIATVLKGKHKPDFVNFLDTGDFVVVINAEKVAVTGNKESDKKYYSHSGFLGGIKETTLGRVRTKKPEEIIRHAVKGMLPKNAMGRKLMKKLKIYKGSEHPHQAQNPEILKF